MDITDIELGRQQWQTLKLGLDALDGTPQSPVSYTHLRAHET